MLWDRYNMLQWHEAEAAAKVRGWKLLSLEIRDAAQLDAAFAKARDARAGALLVFNSALFDREAARVATLAAKARLPAMYGLRLYVDAGGLMSYGPDLIENWRRAATFVDKILKGARPRRAARGTTDEVRTGHQRKGRAGAGVGDAEVAAAAGEPRDSVTRRAMSSKH